MADSPLINIKNYLRMVEEEQNQIEEKERELSENSKIGANNSSLDNSKLENTENSEKEFKNESLKQENKEYVFDPAQDLFEKTEKVLKRYSPAYVSQNVENAIMMLTLLDKASSMLPFNTEFEIRGKIEENISNLRKIIVHIEKSVKKAEEKKILEVFLQDVDKALRKYSKLQIEKDSERAQYEYNILLERRENLPKGNPTYEMVVKKRLDELGNRLSIFIKEINVKKECQVLELHIRNFLKNADKEEFDSLHKKYRQLINEYRLLEPKLEKTEINSIKNGLYRCKELLEKLRGSSQKEIRKRYVQEERKKKEEYLGVRTFWNEYINDLRLYSESLNTAAPSQYFSLYKKYSSMLDLFYNLVRNDMISKEESLQATQILEYVEQQLEVLRQKI